MLDPVTTYRNWEFGKFVLQGFLKHANKEEFQEAKGLGTPEKNNLLESFASNLDRISTKLDDHQKLFLVTAAKEMLLPERLGMAAYDLTGVIVHRHLLGMSFRMELLKTALQESLSLTIKNHNRKGPRR